MQELNRHTFPSGGGWKFRQVQTGWENPLAMVSFTESVKEIIKHRKANPAITAKHKLATDFEDVANELEDFTRKRLGMPAKGAGPFPKPPAKALPPSVALAVGGVKKLASGAALLLDWEQSGEPPVAPEVSEARATICAQCPKNSPGDFTSWFTKPVSEMLRAKLARLHSMNLTTTNDAKINVCDVCLCPLKLKVHTPLPLILRHLKPETRAELPSHCWILAK